MRKAKLFWKELKRRNVVKAAISYVVVAWLIIRVVSLLGDIIIVPRWVPQSLFILLLICFPIWLVLVWTYEVTPEGLKLTSQIAQSDSIRRQTSKKYNKIIIVFLSLSLVVLLIDRFNISRNSETEISQEFVYNAPVTMQAIAVLPFEDYSAENNNTYFADGLTEELLNLLTQVKELKVTSRTSSFSFKNTDLDISAIAEKLNVNYILEGSVRMSNSELRITAQLIEAKSDKHIWSKTYDRKLENVFAIQDEVASQVVNALQLTLLDKKDLPKSKKTVPEAYALYLKSKYELNQSAVDGHLEDAELYAKQALVIDSTYTPVLILLADIYAAQANNGIRSYDGGYGLAHKALLKAKQFEPNNALVYAYLADFELSYNWDFKEAKRLNTKALRLDANSPRIINLSATLALSLGDIDRAIRLQEYSVSLDPVNSYGYYSLSIVYLSALRFEDAEIAINKCIELQPNSWAAYYQLGRILLFQNKMEETMQAIELEEDEGWSLQLLAMANHQLGNTEIAKKYLDELILKYKDEMAFQIAEVYGFMKDGDNTFKWLDYAYQVHDVGLNELLTEPSFINIKGDSRWKEFVLKMNFPQSTSTN